MLDRDSNLLYSIAISELFLSKFSGHFLNPFKCLASTMYCDKVIELLLSVYGVRDLCNGKLILILLLSIHLVIFLNAGYIFLLSPASDK